jgi:hypothetical protein
MESRLEDLVRQIKVLQEELRSELNTSRDEFFYEIHAKKIFFQAEIRRRHQTIRQRLHYYLWNASLLNLITFPIIWLCLPPALLLDLFVSLYHGICFPIYGIPKVARGDYIVVDRQSLAYLNIIEKINCVYCGYFNGLIAYVQEIAARTEQYWCPIKHARRIAYLHSRYDRFFDYGDADAYCGENEAVRRNFQDLQHPHSRD